MSKTVVINDANLLIDISKLQLVDSLFALDNYAFSTVDAVWNELRTDQKMPYQPYIHSGLFQIGTIEVSDLGTVLTIRQELPHLSFPDCIALVYAHLHQAILLTSDENLRSTAHAYHIVVHGHLWLFDTFFTTGILTGPLLTEKLRALRATVYPRLGLSEEECKIRNEQWNK